ncbi:MAG TPA: hypothetical protein VMR34_04050 [Candidatus Saccharimonadales bacterium]|nr:hypothetical protein [Candidatus Saccharimonadales bacterium]
MSHESETPSTPDVDLPQTEQQADTAPVGYSGRGPVSGPMETESVSDIRLGTLGEMIGHKAAEEFFARHPNHQYHTNRYGQVIGHHGEVIRPSNPRRRYK